jgi:hypothetical protein
MQELIRDFGRNTRDQMTTFTEFLHANLSICREMENVHNERMMEMIIVIMDKLVMKKMTVEVEAQLSEVT